MSDFQTTEASRLLAARVEALKTVLAFRGPPGLSRDAVRELLERLDRVHDRVRSQGHVTERDLQDVDAIAERLPGGLHDGPRPVRHVSQKSLDRQGGD